MSKVGIVCLHVKDLKQYLNSIIVGLNGWRYIDKVLI